MTTRLHRPVLSPSSTGILPRSLPEANPGSPCALHQQHTCTSRRCSQCEWLRLAAPFNACSPHAGNLLDCNSSVHACGDPMLQCYDGWSAVDAALRIHSTVIRSGACAACGGSTPSTRPTLIGLLMLARSDHMQQRWLAHTIRDQAALQLHAQSPPLVSDGRAHPIDGRARRLHPLARG